VKTKNLQFTINANLDAYNSASDNEDNAEVDKGVLDLSQIVKKKVYWFNLDEQVPAAFSRRNNAVGQLSL
jgi:hypothetical protein